MSNELVKFNFHGSELDVVHDDADVWVSVRRVCEVLGLAIAPQQQKLGSRAWARVTYVMTTSDGGGSGAENKVRREMFMVHLDSLAMWLATIDPDKVKIVARPKVEDFQVHCATVLRDHFFPSVAPPALPPAHPVDAAIIHGPRLRDDAALRFDIAMRARHAALAQQKTIQAVHGAARKSFRVASIYDVSRLFTPQLRQYFDELALGRLLLPPGPGSPPPVDRRQLRLVWSNRAS